MEGKILHLTLKKRWFDMIASGEKKEEYREIKPYWIKRLISINSPEESMGENKIIPDDIVFDIQNHPSCPPELILKAYYSELKRFDIIFFRNGYSKDAPKMLVECKGITIGEGRPEWGGNGKTFIIHLGEILIP